MRINKFLALYSNLSRRAADKAVGEGRVVVDGVPASLGQILTDDNVVTLNGKKIVTKSKTQTIILNKPVGYVCSRNGQGSRTIYDLLPKDLHNLNPVGRLDKDSSGLLLLTNDGDLANKLTHPRYQKTKVYEVKIDKPINDIDLQKLRSGVELEDGDSKFSDISRISNTQFQVTLKEGRNRQIRRTFAAIGHNVNKLHRISFGPHSLDNLSTGSLQAIM